MSTCSRSSDQLCACEQALNVRQMRRIRRLNSSIGFLRKRRNSEMLGASEKTLKLTRYLFISRGQDLASTSDYPGAIRACTSSSVTVKKLPV